MADGDATAWEHAVLRCDPAALGPHRHRGCRRPRRLSVRRGVPL